MFNEYEYKENYYVNLQFLEKEHSFQGLHNPWEMFSKASKVTSCIYKSELIDTLRLYHDYSDNLNLRNIFIVENDYVKEYQIKNLIENHDLYEQIDQLDMLFSFGRIHSLVPNFFYLRLFEIYSFKFELNKLTKKYKFKCVPNEDFNDLILQYFANSSWKSADVIDKIVNISLKRLYKIKNKNIRRDIDIKINDKSYFYKDKVNKLRKFEKSEERIQIEYLLSNDQKVNDESLRYYYNQYYTKFDSLFKNQKKPIIGVMNSSIGSYNLLSKYSLIYSNNYKKYFINLKKLSHESPLIIDIMVGLGTISATIFGLFEGYNRIKKGQLENHEKEIDIEQKKLNLINSKIEFEKKYFNSKINDYVKNITNNYKEISMDYNIDIKKLDNNTLDDE